MDVDADEDEEEATDEDSSEGYIPPTSEPSWAKRLKNKMKVLFCMQAKGQYQTHVASKGDSPPRQADFQDFWREHI